MREVRFIYFSMIIRGCFTESTLVSVSELINEGSDGHIVWERQIRRTEHLWGCRDLNRLNTLAFLNSTNLFIQ